MKRFNNIYLFLGLAFTACSKDTLVLPVSGDNAETGTIDVIAKPTDVTLVGEYDYKFSVKWPALSENVKKIVISYTDNGETKTKEFTDFTKDAEIQTSQAKEYDFTITSYSADNLASKSRTVKVINKGYKIEQMITSALSSVLDGTTEVIIPNDFALPVKLTVKSPWLNGETKTQILQSNEDIRATFDALDGTHKYTIELEDELGRKVSREMTYEFDYIVNVVASPAFNVTNFSVSNNAKTNAAKVTVNYPTSTGNASKEVLNTNSLTFPAIKSTSAQTVTYSYVDEKGRTATGSVNYTYNPTLINYNTAALRAGWTPYASNSNSTSEGPPSFMLDGNSGTIWHTQWSTTTTSSHSADKKYPFTLVFTFTKSRSSSASGLFNEDALKNPSGPYEPILIKELTLQHRAVNNYRVKDVELYGIDVNGVESKIGNYTLTNTKQDQVIDLSSNEKVFRAVKIICLTTFSATDQFANFNEIFIKGYNQ